MVTGGPLLDEMRQTYAQRGIETRQCYATADVGMIAYETEALDGLVVDDGCIVEIVVPGTGTPVEAGEVGEVIVTSLCSDYPLVRFATGDLSSLRQDPSPCGRTNLRLSGWQGRADQATKVRGAFIRPEQLEAFLAACPGVKKARIEVTGGAAGDRIALLVESESPNMEQIVNRSREVFKVRMDVSARKIGSLPNDGLVIADLRRR